MRGVMKKNSFFIVLLMLFGVMVSADEVLEEVVVTAQKRSQDIQEVPISMQALSGDFLAESQLTDLNDLQSFVPGLKINTTANPRNAVISLRGIGTSGVNAGIEQSVAIYIDDVYYVRPASAMQDLVDIDAIEVLRGPQGTLYGRNNSVGSIKIMTRAPTQEFEAMGSFGVGEYNLRTAKGYISGGITEDVSARLSIFTRARDGYDKNTYLSSLGRNNEETLNDDESYGGRGQLMWEISENTDLRIISDYANKETTCCTADWKIVTPGLIAFSDKVVEGTGDQNKTFDNFVPFDNRLQSFVPPRSIEKNYGASATLNHTVSSGRFQDSIVTSVTSYRNSKIKADQYPTNLPMSLVYSNDTEETITASEEIRIASPSDQKLEWVTGIYLYYQESTFDTLTYFGEDFQYALLARLGFDPAINAGSEQGATLDGTIETRSYSAFFQSTYHLTDRWALTAGVRFTKDDKDADVINGNNNTSRAVQAALPSSIFNEDRSDTEATWQFMAQYDMADNAMLYATASKGFKSGGFNARRLRTGTQFEFESEFVKNYEVGIKSTWQEDRLIANATYFYMPVEGFQSSQLNPQGTGVIVTNVGDVLQKGLEFELRALPIDNLTLVFSATYLDSEYTDFEAAPCAIDGGGPPSTVLSGACDLTGFPMNDAPEWTGSAVATYRVPLASLKSDLFSRAEFLYVDDHFQDQDLATQSLQESYQIWNFRIGLESDDGKWNVTGYIENAFDEDYAGATLQAVFGGPLGAAGSYVVYKGPPRMAGIEALVRF